MRREDEEGGVDERWNSLVMTQSADEGHRLERRVKGWISGYDEQNSKSKVRMGRSGGGTQHDVKELMRN